MQLLAQIAGGGAFKPTSLQNASYDGDKKIKNFALSAEFFNAR